MCATIAHNLVRWLGVLGLKIHGPTRLKDDPEMAHSARILEVSK